MWDSRTLTRPDQAESERARVHLVRVEGRSNAMADTAGFAKRRRIRGRAGRHILRRMAGGASGGGGRRGIDKGSGIGHVDPRRRDWREVGLVHVALAAVPKIAGILDVAEVIGVAAEAVDDERSQLPTWRR